MKRQYDPKLDAKRSITPERMLYPLSHW